MNAYSPSYSEPSFYGIEDRQMALLQRYRNDMSNFEKQIRRQVSINEVATIVEQEKDNYVIYVAQVNIFFSLVFGVSIS